MLRDAGEEKLYCATGFIC